MLCFQLSFENADDFDSLAVLIRKIMRYRTATLREWRGGENRKGLVRGLGWTEVLQSFLSEFMISQSVTYVL